MVLSDSYWRVTKSPSHPPTGVTAVVFFFSILHSDMVSSNDRMQLAAAFGAGAATAAGLGLLLIQPHLRKRQAVFVPKPHPGWTPSQKQEPPHDPDNMHEVDPSVVDKLSVYPLVISAIVPRPIGESAAG
eukprot:GHRQ01019629.1.p1 GENE.GHRQ01019629.1~~GHRQ01019629.1.p1  ORF type:complete len:130 (+),score=30.10 GHRQ01019629.1:103-492(+)